MNSVQFKTTINCKNCLAKVTPYLDAVEGIVHWEVDINNPDKVLTVYGETLDQDAIEGKVKEAGYKIEKVESR